MIQDKTLTQFSTPVVYPNPTSFGQKFGNFANRSLYLGGSIAYVISPKENIVEVRKESVSCWQKALKISLFVLSLGLIPLVMVIVKAICRSSSKFYKLTKTQQTGDSSYSIIPDKVDTFIDIEKIATSLLKKYHLENNDKLKFKNKNKKYICMKNIYDGIKIQLVNKTLGRGGGAKVTELIDLNTKQKTALKVATPMKKVTDYDHDKLKLAEEDLRQEVKVLSSLNANGDVAGIQKAPLFPAFRVIKAYNSRSENRLAIEEEVYDGSLDKLNVSAIMDLSVQLSIIYQIAKGVQHFRKKDIVHSDLKPANILYKKDGNNYKVDICDFGSSWKKGHYRGSAITRKYSKISDIREIDDSLTERGQLFSGKKHDIYCLGTTLRELLFGHVTRLQRTMKNKMVVRMNKAGLKSKGIKTFFEILERMVAQDSHDILEKIWSSSKRRPSIQEVVNAVKAVCIELSLVKNHANKVYNTGKYQERKKSRNTYNLMPSR